YDADGWRGVVALRALTIALLVGVIVFTALRERPVRPLGAVIVALPAIALSRFVWTERPELFGFVCFALLVPLLRAGRAGSAAALYWIPPLILLWANLHGSFALGVVLVVLVAVEGAIAQPSRRRMYAAAAAGSLIATLFAPRQMPLFAIAAAPYLTAFGGGALVSLASLLHLRAPSLASTAHPPGPRADAIAVLAAAAVIALAAGTGVSAPELGGFPGG